ncbi:MAG: hypothetical protein U9N39_02625, partial [Campylobacterota bacterium]|nr:hypothetical protein [Campylobacterota bacterium]
DDKKKLKKKLKKVEKYHKKTYPNKDKTDIQILFEDTGLENKEDKKTYISSDVIPQTAVVDIELIMRNEQRDREIQKMNRENMENMSKPTYVTNNINTVNGDNSIAGNNNSIKLDKKNGLFMKILGFIKFW